MMPPISWRNPLRYRGFFISPTDPCPPIPVRCYDWEWVRSDQHADGPDIEHHGHAQNIAECKTAIDEWFLERDDATIDWVEDRGAFKLGDEYRDRAYEECTWPDCEVELENLKKRTAQLEAMMYQLVIKGVDPEMLDTVVRKYYPDGQCIWPDETGEAHLDY